MMTSPMTGNEILDTIFLEVRAKLLEVAASLDRVARADEDGSLVNDARLEKIRESLRIIGGDGFDRAEQIQLLFSDDYIPGWNKE